MLLQSARRLRCRFGRACSGAAAPPEACQPSPEVAVATALDAAAAEIASLRQRLRLAPHTPLRLALGLSGGVDSALCGALLSRLPGVHLTPVFMKNWDEAEESDSGSSCNFAAERASAVQVAAHLGLPLQEVDFVREYWHAVFQPFLASAAAGGTPNPDLACNRHIKFGALHKWALSAQGAGGIGAHALVTGHYARLRNGPAGATSQPQLVRGADEVKDQSYFLASVPAAALATSVFPLGSLTKGHVRAAAAHLGLPSASKRSSAGICFVGRRPFGEFLGRYVAPSPGRFIDVDTGIVLGSHADCQALTHGQRARLGGHASPWFVVGKSPAVKGDVFVAPGKDHQALYCTTAVVGALFWVGGDNAVPPQLSGGPASTPATLQYKARYGQPVASAAVVYVPDAAAAGGEATAEWRPSGRCVPLSPALAAPEGGTCPGLLHVTFAVPERAVTPGQALVLYDGDVCLGGGVVLFPGPSLHEQGQDAAAAMDAGVSVRVVADGGV
jgi:tRNA (5-methylaminomethyl-2-thiouridylate)-methyltransferase